MILQVKLITGEALTFKVDKSSCTIGRSGQCDVVIPHEAVSRKHCQIDYVNGDLFVIDLGSINGVAIDGQKITPNTPVKFQSFFTLSFGAVQSLNVELDEERTSVQQNPLLTTTLQIRDQKRPQRSAVPTPKTDTPAQKKAPTEEAKEVPMSNFIILCIVVVLGFAFFIFREEISSLLE
jgi:pSer/pThr/pTyr-binding forkhead associated (FHA) protein